MDTKKERKRTKRNVAIVLSSIVIGTVAVFLYFAFNGSPWEKQTAISESKAYITNYFNLDAEVKNTSFNGKMGTYTISFETNEGEHFDIGYKGPNHFDISPGVQEYLSKHYKFTE
ncbi:spore coat protein C [Bacillus sp. DX4.1]|uniref:YfjL-like protein n=1 Tax=Bacillus sp. DX4.1 TaxID=3055867 RepID=UPI0025A1738B|nr:spore coat protein C [Bacillus sp. DX4.1]MDM5190221.1 spore coat protein C [Bacillus sp. DX4.1]